MHTGIASRFVRWRRIVLAVVLIGILVFVARILNLVAVSPSPINLFAFEVAAFASAGIALALRKPKSKFRASHERVRGPPTRSRVMTLTAGFVVTITTATLLLWGSRYVPDPPYYFAISAAAALIVLEIILCSGTAGRFLYLILLEITTLGALIQISFAWLSPNSLFADIYSDWLGITSIVQTGRVPPGLGYFYYFPSHHLFNAMAVEILGLEMNSYLFFGHVVMVLAIPAAYLLGREIVGPSRALAASLLVAISLFFFLVAAVLPVLLGANLMILATYALLMHHRTNRLTWWAVFWLLAIFVFLSHPVNALILALVLVIFAVVMRLARINTSRGSLTSPAVTYGVAYVGYLMFIAVSAFSILVQSVFESGPRYYFASTVSGPVPSLFVLQAAWSTLGIAILFLPATATLASWLFDGATSHAFALGVVASIAAVPAAIVVLGRGPYGLQAARTLLYLSIFIGPPAAAGLLVMLEKPPHAAKKIIAIVVVVFLLTLSSTTSYLNGSGNRFLSDTVPVQASYVTDSMLAVGPFLNLLPTGETLGLDPAVAPFLAPPSSGVTYPVTAFPIQHTKVVALPKVYGNASVTIVVSNAYLSIGGYQASDFSSLSEAFTVRPYDNGAVRVYVVGD